MYSNNWRQWSVLTAVCLIVYQQIYYEPVCFGISKRKYNDHDHHHDKLPLQQQPTTGVVNREWGIVCIPPYLRFRVLRKIWFDHSVVIQKKFIQIHTFIHQLAISNMPYLVNGLAIIYLLLHYCSRSPAVAFHVLALI